MKTSEPLEIIARDEDSKHQLKANVSLAQEMIAFSNTLGGMLAIGAGDDSRSPSTPYLVYYIARTHSCISYSLYNNSNLLPLAEFT